MHRFRLVALILALAVIAGPLMLARSEKQDGPPVVFSDYPPIEPRGYVCHRTDKAPVIDGKLSDEAWRSAAWSEDFVDIEGDKKPLPRQRTRVKMLWDDEYLYIGAQLDETHVWASLTQHDSVIFQDNDFEVFVDPNSSSHLYAELEINALNTTWDLLLTKPYKDKGKAIGAWEIPGLKTAVHVDGTLNDPRDVDRGWSVAIAWPWTSFKEICPPRAPPGPPAPRDGDRWRINFSRVEWQHEVEGGRYRKVKGRAEDNWVWSPQGAVDMHRPERWGIVQFSTARPGSVKFQKDPAADVRQLLHRVLYAQRDFHKARRRWAERLSDLKLTGPAFAGVKLETTSTSFEASAAAPGPEGKMRRWHIAADARIWAE